MEFTGYVDKCEFCEKEFKVENLEYAHHPDFEKYDESEYYVFCADCQDIVGSKFEDLWRKLNTEGAYDMEKDCTKPWGFTWGRDDIEHIKKACATVMKEDYVDTWLDTPSPAFRKTPKYAIEQGDYEDVYAMVYHMGCGEFS